jgi:hypothetical protein
MRDCKNFNGDRNRAFVLRVVCGCLLFVPMKALAANDPNTSASNSTYNAEIVKEDKAKDSCKLTVFTLEITDKTKHEVARVTFGGIGERIRSIKKLYLFENNKLVVHGNLERADIIYVVDCETDNVVDMFWCYDPVLSPSKRFWVYENFYPYHGLKSTQTTVVLVYDMKRTPLENRVPVKGYTEWPESQVGLPIYPGPYVEEKAYVLPRQQQENPFWYLRSSPFLWSQDANDVVFLCNHQKQTYMVRVNISAGIDKPKIFEAPVNVGSFVKASLPEEYRKREADRLHTVSATEIYWDGKDHVIAKPNKVYYTLQDKIRIPVP